MMSVLVETHLRAADVPIEDSRSRGSSWELTSIRERLRVIRSVRQLIAENADALAHAAAQVGARPLEEKLVSEVLPLADACRWLEGNASSVLAPRSFGRRGRPFWMRDVTFEVQRQPLGKVLVIGPGNYPLFLPAVQALHALVAGNTALIKPAPRTTEVAVAFARLANEAGIGAELLTVLPESVEAVRDVLEDGVDKVIFTGSSLNGRDLLGNLATTNTPAVMELSGEDAVIVLDDADLDLVVRAIRFGMNLNGGETCIAPRRLIVVETVADELSSLFLASCAPYPPIERARDEKDAVARVNKAECALGASIFSRDIAKAQALATRIHTGFVIINDLIVPTADPRMPFGGVKASGFGSTRGAEGLLEMTSPHVVAVRRGSSRPHFDETKSDDARLFSAYIRAAHGRWRFSARWDLLSALIKRIRTYKKT